MNPYLDLLEVLDADMYVAGLRVVAFVVALIVVLVGVLAVCAGAFLLWTSKSAKRNRIFGLVSVIIGLIMTAVAAVFLVSLL